MLKPKDKAKFTRLANLKLEQSELKIKIDKLQADLLVGYPDIDQFDADAGKLKRQGRDTLVMDNTEIAREMGVKAFIENATISKTKIAKFGGDALLSHLFDDGHIVLDKTTYSFRLYKKKAGK